MAITIDTSQLVGLGSFALGVISTASVLVPRAARGFRRIMLMAEDWSGEVSRPGVPARRGVMERLADQDAAIAEVRGQLGPNGGASMKDQLARVEQRVITLERRMAGAQVVVLDARPDAPGEPVPEPERQAA